MAMSAHISAHTALQQLSRLPPHPPHPPESNQTLLQILNIGIPKSDQSRKITAAQTSQNILSAESETYTIGESVAESDEHTMNLCLK